MAYLEGARYRHSDHDVYNDWYRGWGGAKKLVAGDRLISDAFPRPLVAGCGELRPLRF